MSKLDELIKQYCPDGVKFVKLGEVLQYEQPSKYIVKSTDYVDDGTPVLTAGQTFILGYTNEENGIYQASKQNPVVIFDDFTTSFHWVEFPFKVKSSAMKMLKPNNDDVSFRFLYYAMQCINYKPEEHTRQWISTYSQFEIPLPPLAIQSRIVEILDNFSSLTAELQAELQARRSQYEYYRNHLISFDGYDNIQKENNTTTNNSAAAQGKTVKWVKLGEIGEVKMCKRIMKHQTTKEGEIPFYKIGSFGGTADAYISRELFEEYKEKYSYPKKGDLLISAAGTIGRTVVFDGKDAYFQDSNIVWLDNDESIVINNYLKHLYRIIDWKTDGGTIKRLYNTNLLNTVIPVPSLSEQRRIADILDRFEALTTDLQCGLPAEIQARQQQYEYYRNKLLTFND